jgi:hypothetical protein
MRIATVTLGLLFLLSCNNLMDADLTERSTFIKLFNGIQGIEAADCQPTVEDDGYIILGNMTIGADSVLTVVFKTDKRGNRVGSIRYYQGGSGHAIKAITNGYLIVGDKLKLIQSPSGLIGVYSTHLLQISNNLDSLSTQYLRDNSTNSTKVSYKGVGLTVTPDKKPVILGTYQTSLDAPERPYLQTLSADLQNEEWYYEFDLINKDYRLTKAVHYNSGDIIWAASIALEQQNFDDSYVCIPNVIEGLNYKNYSLTGESSSQKFKPNDIQPSKTLSFGFGVVGTRANSNNNYSNIFFLRTDVQGSIIPGSIKYFDALITGRKEAVQENCSDPINPSLPPFPCSEIQDYGTALTSTSDGGFVLAGHFTTTDSSDDILLLKLDAFGTVLWVKTIGGTGREQVSTIRETEDQGLLLCGTNVVGNVPSIFLIKTNKNGELKN